MVCNSGTSLVPVIDGRQHHFNYVALYDGLALNLVGTLYSPDFLHTIEQEDQHIGLILDDRFERDTALGIFFRSDQFPFILHDVPAFWFFTGFHPDYHHVTDTVDRVDFPKMTKIVRLSYLTLFAIADEKQTPKFIANPALGK